MQINKTKLYYLTVAFLTGACVMGIELTASRIIAPFFGTSTFVWTNVIGVIMVALSLGYFVGGKLSEKYPQDAALFYSILVAGIFLCVIPLAAGNVSDLVLKGLEPLHNAGYGIFFGSLITLTLLFFIPVFLLAFVSPYIISLLAKTYGHVGNMSGDVFAVSTVGSIVGTFLPVLVLIPLLGTRKTILLFAVTLMVIGAVGCFRRWMGILFILVLIPVWMMLSKPVVARDGLVAEGESAYQFMQVVDQGSLRHLLINDGAAVYSSKNALGPLTGYYYDYYSLLPALIQKKEPSVLVLGLAAGTIADQLIDIYHGTKNVFVDGVDIDPKVIEIGNKYFDMARPNLTPIVSDGRTYLAQTDKKYDVIVVDTYAHQLYISFPFTTKEFFTLAKERLTPDGYVAFNINAINTEAPLLKALVRTMQEVFPNVSIVKTGDTYNYMVIAGNTDAQIALQDTQVPEVLQPLYAQVRDNIQTQQKDDTALVLTDDRSPIEYLTDYMILTALSDARVR